MRKARCVLVAAAVLFSLAPLVWSGEPEARAVIDKAIKAHGGETNLAKFQSQTLKGAGTFYGMGDEGIPFTGEWAFQGVNQSRFQVSVTVGGQTFKLTKVVNGNKGWIKLNDDKAAEMNKEQLFEAKHENYTGWLTSLAPLKDKAFKLSSIGEVKVGDQAAIGIRVSKDGHRDVTLYFDKGKGLLIKAETLTKDVDGGGDKELNQEYFYSAFKEIDGTQQPMKMFIKREGKRFVEAELTEVRAQKLENSLFDMP